MRGIVTLSQSPLCKAAMNSSYTSLVGLKGSGTSDSSLGHSRALSRGQAWALLDEASDLLVVHRNFAAALEVCERGCQAINADPESRGNDCSTDETTSLCIVGIQALAEMNRWREVLSWLLQYYEVPEKLPVKLLEMCILLHSKVEEPSAMLDVAGDWLRHKTNQRRPEYASVVKLYLMQVLLPLDQFDEAEELVLECGTFSEKQQQGLLGTIAERKQASCVPSPNGKTEGINKVGTVPEEKQTLGPVPRRLKTLLNFLYRVMTSAQIQILSFPIKKIVLTALLICLLMLRLDAASSTAQPYFSTLLRMLQQIWSAIGPIKSRPGIHH